MRFINVDQISNINPIKNDTILSIPEMESVAKFLEESAMAYAIHGNTRLTVTQKMNEMLELPGPARIIKLLNILYILSETREKEKLASHRVYSKFQIIRF